ncbi:MAG: hypothetical protein ACOC5T_08250 [Elusimicrobiota bacterium]
MKHCNKCKLTIDTDKERYVKVIDKQGKKELSKLYFHKNCWKEIMDGKQKSQQAVSKAMKIMNFAAKKLGYEDKEVYSI